MRMICKEKGDSLAKFFQLEIVPYIEKDEFTVFASWGKVDVNDQDIVLEYHKTIGRGTFEECEEIVNNKIQERKTLGYKVVERETNTTGSS